MYKKISKITTSQGDPSNYIEGYDVYNSLLVNKLRDSQEEKIAYQIKTKDYRPDLIAKELYGDTKWMGLLMMTCGIGLEGYKKGTIILVYPKSSLEKILGSL